MSILGQIEATKREELAREIAGVPLVVMKARALGKEPRRGFARALRQASRRPALIAEIKKASPSAGVIRPNFDPVALARTYEEAGATCLSVLTDRPYFQGDDAYLAAIRAEVQLPLLRKDFTLDPYQIWQARALGADAVLLIVAMLSREDLAALIEVARQAEMDALVEVHNEGELETALELEAELIGVNNRDLGTFETSLELTERLIPRIEGERLRVSESALHLVEDVRRAHAAGADAVLIGTAFCAAEDVAGRVREVMGW